MNTVKPKKNLVSLDFTIIINLMVNLIEFLFLSNSSQFLFQVFNLQVH